MVGEHRSVTQEYENIFYLSENIEHLIGGPIIGLSVLFCMKALSVCVMDEWNFVVENDMVFSVIWIDQLYIQCPVISAKSASIVHCTQVNVLLSALHSQ